MLGLGFWEIVLIGIIALLVVGPDQLPYLARNLARFINEIKRSTDDFKRELNADDFLSSSQEEENRKKAQLKKEQPKAIEADERQDSELIEKDLQEVATAEKDHNKESN